MQILWRAWAIMIIIWLKNRNVPLLRSVRKNCRKRTEPVARFEKNRLKKLSFKEARELESLEGVIAGAESRIAEIEAMFADPDFFRKHGRESVSLQEELDQAKADLENHYLRWEELEIQTCLL